MRWSSSAGTWTCSRAMCRCAPLTGLQVACALTGWKSKLASGARQRSGGGFAGAGRLHPHTLLAGAKQPHLLPLSAYAAPCIGAVRVYGNSC